MNSYYYPALLPISTLNIFFYVLGIIVFILLKVINFCLVFGIYFSCLETREKKVIIIS